MEDNYKLEKKVLAAALLAIGLGIINIVILIVFAITMLKGVAQ